MKYFATALIVSTAFAQFDPTDCCSEFPRLAQCQGCPPLESEAPADFATAESNEYVPEPEPTLAEKLFEKNEDGQFQLVWPQKPAISVTDADDAAIQAWFEGKMAEATAHDMEFVQAYKDYESAVSQPYNDFLTQVEDLTIRGMQMGAKNDQEIIDWIAKNTFVDGQSLYDKYPQIDEVLAGIQAQADRNSEAFSLDRLRATPNALYYKHHSLQNSESPVDYYEEGEWEEPSHPVKEAFQEDMEQAAENLMSYGFDPHVVNAWFEDKSQSFDDLQKKHDMEAAKLAQKATRQAADYLKDIADKWSADSPRLHEEWMVEKSEQFPRLIETYKDQINAQAAKDIANIEAWIQDTYDEIVDVTEGCPFDHEEELVVDEPIDFDPTFVALAQKAQGSSKRERYAYGFGAASAGFAAMAAYIYFSKKQQKVVESEKKESLIDADTEFQMV